MIRIQRGTEPPELVEVRARRLADAAAARAAGEKIEFVDYDIVKPKLAAMQHSKCGYCEKREEQAKYRDVDHHRPKSPYWWLAWTWENLLFSCIDCNREHKRDQYPLEAGNRLVAQEVPPGLEKPLLLDPTDPQFKPTDHIEFRRDKVLGREQWKPYGLSARGRATIDVCGLDRPSLLDLYKFHIDEVVRSKLRAFWRSVEREQLPDIHHEWSYATRGLLGRERPFRALSFDALRILVPLQHRDKYKLELPQLV